MEFITAIWSKLNKPFHYLIAGIAYSYYAPEEMKWPGYILATLGVIVLFNDYVLQTIIIKIKRNLHIERHIQTLNLEEEEILYKQIKSGEKTFYASVSEDISLPNHFRRANIYYGLRNKGILIIHGNSANMVLHITDQAWNRLLHKWSNASSDIDTLPTSDSREFSKFY